MTAEPSDGYTRGRQFRPREHADMAPDDADTSTVRSQTNDD